MTETLTTGVQTDRPTDSDDEAASATVRVIEAVAEAADADPLAMEPLAAVVDPDALDGLLSGPFDGHVSFAYAGHEVSVHGDGAVVVDREGR